VTTGAITRAKLQSNHHHQETMPHLSQARYPSYHPTNSVKALKAESTTFQGLAHPELTWGLTTVSWAIKAPRCWGRVARPLVSPLTSVPQTENGKADTQSPNTNHLTPRDTWVNLLDQLCMMLSVHVGKSGRSVAGWCSVFTWVNLVDQLLYDAQCSRG